MALVPVNSNNCKYLQCVRVLTEMPLIESGKRAPTSDLTYTRRVRRSLPPPSSTYFPPSLLPPSTRLAPVYSIPTLSISSGFDQYFRGSCSLRLPRIMVCCSHFLKHSFKLSSVASLSRVKHSHLLVSAQSEASLFQLSSDLSSFAHFRFAVATDKHSKSGGDARFIYSISEMQGWRISE